MRRTIRLASAGLVALMAAAPAHAAVLLKLTDPAPGVYTYNLSFIPSANETTLYVGGYQLPSTEEAINNGVFSGGGPNLLGNWTLSPATAESYAFTFGDGTAVPALFFGGWDLGDYDTFKQTFATTPGTVYTYSFVFSEDNIPPSGFIVSVSDAEPVFDSLPPEPAFDSVSAPESATWALMGLGFLGLGLVGLVSTSPLGRRTPAP